LLGTAPPFFRSNVYDLDLSVLYFFNQTLASPATNAAVGIITNVRYWYAIYVIGAIYLIYRRKGQGLRIVLAAILLVMLTDSLGHYILKPYIGRLRPCTLLPNGSHLVAWIRLPEGMRFDPSFPSLHALNNFAVATFFLTIWHRKQVVLWMFAMATVISLGRVYDGLHYPSDVLGGAVIGSAVALLYALLFRKLESRIS
jgi:undecaprenyl-diphosphatase